MNQSFTRSDDTIKNLDLYRSGWNWCICRVCISMFLIREVCQILSGCTHRVEENLPRSSRHLSCSLHTNRWLPNSSVARCDCHSFVNTKRNTTSAEDDKRKKIPGSWLADGFHRWKNSKLRRKFGSQACQDWLWQRYHTSTSISTSTWNLHSGNMWEVGTAIS